MKKLALTMVGSLLLGAMVSAHEEGQPSPKVARTIYVPIIKAKGLSRDESLRMTELLIKSIEKDMGLKVVGSPENADLVFEGDVRPTK